MTRDGIDLQLTDDEREFLRSGLGEWGGPASCTPALAAAMGFRDVATLYAEGEQLRGRLARREPLSARDWRRALLATEIVFASDVVGSGTDWSTTTGFSDEESIRLLRALQYKIVGCGY